MLVFTDYLVLIVQSEDIQEQIFYLNKYVAEYE